MTLEQSKCKLFYFQEKHAKEIFFHFVFVCFFFKQGKNNAACRFFFDRYQSWFFNLSFTHLTFYVLFYLVMQTETEVFKLLMELLNSAISCSIILQINGEQNGFCPCKPVCCGVSKMTEGNWLL